VPMPIPIMLTSCSCIDSYFFFGMIALMSKPIPAIRIKPSKNPTNSLSIVVFSLFRKKIRAADRIRRIDWKMLVPFVIVFGFFMIIIFELILHGLLFPGSMRSRCPKC